MPLNVGVIGLGVGRQHLLGYERLDGCRVTAICDLDEELLAAEAATRPGVRATTDADTVLTSDAVDAVSIASYDDAHYPQALLALEHGKHVFVEKPICRSLAEARALAAAAAARPGTVVASNLVLRAAPLYRHLRDRADAGAFGRIYAFDGDYLYGRLHKITDGWRGDVDDYSVMLGGGVHLVDLMLWLLGERPHRVSAAGNRISTEGTKFRYDDFVAATFEFPSGAVGRITANFGSVHPHHHVVRLFGTEATVVYDDAGPRLHESRDPGVPAHPLPFDPLPSSKADLIPDFVHRAAARDAGGAGAQHDLAVVCACVAADSALAKGEPVDIEYP